VARRYQHLSKEISELDEHLDRQVSEVAPELIAVEGIGTDTAASVLIAAADNPERLKNEDQPSRTTGARRLHRFQPLRARVSVTALTAARRPRR